MNRQSKRSETQFYTATAHTNGAYHFKDLAAKCWDSKLPFLKLGFFQSAFLVALAACVCFGNSYDGDFVFDDSEAILTNPDVKAERPWQDLFFNDFWGNKLISNTSHKSYRPLTVLTFRLNHYLSGGGELQPQGFHIVNIILHAIVSVLLLPVFSVLLGGTSASNEGKLQFSAPRASLLASLIFSVHPIHTECVSGIVGRADLLCALCFLLAFLCYVKSTLTDYEGQSEVLGNIWLIVSLALAVAATLCKEHGITVLGLCSAYDILGHHRLDLMSVICRSRKAKRQHPAPCVFPTFQRHFALAVTGLVVLISRLRLQGSPPTFQRWDNPQSFVEPPILRWLNYQYIYLLNGLLLAWPSWCCFDWSMGCVAVIEQWSDTRLIPGIGFSALVFSGVLVSLWKTQNAFTRCQLLALAWLIVPFLPASNIFFRVGFVVAERILYLPSIGFIMLFVLGLSRLAEKNRKLVIVMLCVVLLTYMLKSVQRSNEWRREKSLFEAGAAVCPNNAKVHYNLGKVWSDSGHMKESVGYYRRAIELHPQYDQAMNNLANILKDWGQLEEAEDLLTKAVTIRPEFAAAWMNLGIVQASLAKTSVAEASYLKALRHRRKYPDCYYNLGNLYLDVQRHADALIAWRNATTLRPSHVSAWSNAMLLLDNLGRSDDSLSVGREALRHNPATAAIHYNMANTLGKVDRYEESAAHFLEAIRLHGQPEDAMYYSNLGVLYHRWNKLSEAEKMYRKALQIDPNCPNTEDYLSRVIQKLKKQAGSN